MKQVKKTKVLLEMRPALEGFAGIPQETRLLFRGLRMLDNFEVEGMIQTSHRILAKGTSNSGLLFSEQALREERKINRYSRVVISVAERPYNTVFDRVMDYMQRRMMSTQLTLSTVLGFGKVRMSNFRSKYFEDFIWRTLFSKTLPASDYALVSNANQRICHTPWHVMHMTGLATLNFLTRPRYPMLSTPGIDVFIGQTPYPARVKSDTAFVVRYHDAIPVFMPHTIPDKSIHQATHFYALMSNVRSGAYFACVSEATRQDLLRLFPEAADRAVTIHNMVSHHYFKEDANPERVPGIVRARLHEGDKAKGVNVQPDFLSLREMEGFYRRVLGKRPFRYLLVVSTVEPRKNHSRLLAAWEVIKADIDPDLKLIVVGGLGWDYATILKGFRPWIEQGDLFMLNAVPAPDLRVLYRNAVATVCPSLGEGFDFSGVESMSSGGVVLASDIPVHREVYDDASEYFDPYSTASLVKSLKKVLYSDDAEAVQQQLRERGQEVGSRYQPEKILPRWNQFLEWVVQHKGVGVFGQSAVASAKPLALRDLDGAASPQ